jgi:hypothetical protein
MWAADLVELGMLDESLASRLATFLTAFREQVFPEVEAARRRREFATGVLPALKGTGVTVELRAVTDKHFQWGDDVSQFDPTIVETIPVISVLLGLDSGTPDSVTFQASPAICRDLISELEAALKTAEAFESFAARARKD